MVRSVRVAPSCIEKVKSALVKNGFPTQGHLARELKIALCTINKFFNGKPVYFSKCEDICHRLGLSWQEIIDLDKSVGTVSDTEVKENKVIEDSEISIANHKSATGSFYACDNFWVGREKLITELSAKLRSECRLLLLLGLTGIGKTALAERLAVELQDWFAQDWKSKYKRANFDYQEKTTDFASVALQWLEEWGEKTSQEEKQPEQLLQKLVRYLRSHQVLVIIDSLERLLTVNEAGVVEFVDEWWEKFFLSLLSSESCLTRLIVTSQDLPVKLLSSRYQNFWHRQALYGLTEAEQVKLFEISGLDVSLESVEYPLLLRIGKAYKGHPLALRVIIGEIGSEPYYGNVQAYWNDVSGKIEEVEKALLEAEQGKIEGVDDWQLHRLTAELRIQVNERLEATFERLLHDIKDAYLLICAASVYRAPVQQEGWLMQLAAFAKRLEGQSCSQERQEMALEQLCDRFLVEESVNHNNKRVLGQHNLVRSVALSHYRKLLQSFKSGNSAV
ncbi:ATP-binding protein [Aerosakkonemataceae cyanobacterium BLCC-F50]|uniref:ATP-binding protein n=1 Tax=Floridaenema flaviceps BLCC-F50 TaxID=3153642 RepID=A0ABV4XTA8_9CYAN